MKTLISEIPQLSGYRLTGNGRLVLKSATQPGYDVNHYPSYDRQPSGGNHQPVYKSGSSDRLHTQSSAFVDELTQVINGTQPLVSTSAFLDPVPDKTD